TTNEQIGNATRVNLAQGATLTLGGNETIGALSDKASPTATGTASVDLGSHTLRVNTTPDTLATTFSGVISGVDGQLTKTGAGSLTLGGVNTYTGSTTVSAGELALGTSNALNSASTLVVNGGTLNLGSNSSTVAGVSLQGGTLTGTSGVLASASAFDVRSGTVDAILDGASGAATAIGLTKTGIGTVTLNRANLYRGQTTISAGELALGTGNAINAASTLVVNGGTLNLGANANTVAGVSLQGGTLTGTSGVLTSASTFDVRSGSVDAILDGVSGATTAIGLTKTGAGTVTLNRANLYEGQTTVSAGVLALGTANAINPASTVVINGGTLNLGTNANTVAGVSLQGGTIAGTSGVLTSASTFDVQSGSVNAILDGVVAAGTPAIGLTKTGTGTVTLSRNNAYQGTTTVSDGRLALGTVNAIHPSGRLIVNGGTLDLGANASTLAGVSLQLGTITGTSGVLTSASTFDIQSGSVNAILDGVAVAAGTPAIGLAKTGASTAALNRANLYRGQTTISAGELALGTGNAINAASVLVVNGGTLNLGGNANTVAGVSLQGGTLTGTSGVLTSASTFDVRSGSVDAILAGAAVAAGAPAIGLSKTSAGTVTLNRANLYRGQTTVSAGELALGTGNAINPAGTLVVNGGTLNLGTNANTVAGVSLQSGSLTGTGGVLTSTTDFDVRSGSVSAVLAGSTPRIGLTKTTGGSVTLSAANTFTGTTDVSAGTLNLNHGSALANSAVSMGNTAGAVLNLLTDASVGSLSGGGASGGQVTLGTHTLSTGANNSSTTYSGVIAGSSGAVTKVGNGTLTLDSANTYGGHTLVNAGILAVAHASALGSATGVASGTSVADGAVLALGSVVLGGESLQLQGSGINNAGALVVTGTSRLDGPVVLAGSTTIGSKNALLINGLLSTAANVNGPVTLTKIDAGDLTVAGAGSSLGTSSSKGNLDVKDGRVILATPVQNVGTLSVASQKTLQLGRDASATDQTADTLDLSGNLTGTGVLTAGNYKLTNATVEVDLGPGNLTASGASQLAGTAAVGSATVADGTLTLGSAGRFTADPTVQVNSNATLITKGAESLASLNAAGSVNLGGDLTTSGDMRFSGAVTMDEQKGMTLTSGQRIEALNDGNRWGNSLTVTATGPVNLFAGRDAAGARTLTLGTLSLAQGGSINAGVLNLDGNVTVSGGVLQLVASAAATPAGDIIPAELQGKQTPAPEATLTPRQIVFASDVVRQQDGTRVLVSPGAQLKIQASGGGSVKLASVDNNFAGGLEVISGTANSAWTDRAFNPVINGRSEARSLQGRVQVNATELNVAGAGLEADVISLTSDSLTTAAGSVIAARLPYDPQGGPSRNLPALTLITTDAAHSQANGGRAPYGVGGGGEIAINVGNKAWATATRSGPNSGFVSVQRPGGNSAGSSALSVVLTGPQVGAGAYTFFTLGAGQDGSIPVFYNGLGTLTASEALAVGSTVSVAESARKERFDDAVRTENVAVRLRQGVIAEVGPGRPATQGSDGLRPPLPCQPASLSLSCEQ
ncbi:MAG: hypothetical protein RLZZ584_3166, partial [Pseudomonadota bacterium]